MSWSGKEGTTKFEHWWESHQHNCHANFEGSSNAMDASGCVKIFERSVEKYSLRYVDFLGDGDSKAYNQLVESAVYGEKEINKLECVGHIQKRMGSRLRSLKKRMGKTRLADGKNIGGRGRLTDQVIDNLQVYYGKAIRNNTHSIKDMENAVMAIWHHTRSTDDDPHHELCPAGENSWCGYQRDLAKNTSTYSHQHSLPEAVADCILPTFQDLSKTELLSSCLHGGTQNQNEAFNALIWQRATKQTHSSLPTLELATNLAVGVFNDGAGTIKSVVEHLGIKAGIHTKKACKKQDHDRLRDSARKNLEKTKKRRKKIRQRKKGYNETLTEMEGTVYEAGAF